MIPCKVIELCSAVGGELLQDADVLVTGITTDSRKVGENELFIPLAGEKFDGHAYLDSALRSNGYRTGLYTSPYLCRYNERIRVNGEAKIGETRFKGIITGSEYYGLYIKYFIHVGETTLKVVEKNDGINIYGDGQAVEVCISPEDVMSYDK